MMRDLIPSEKALYRRLAKLRRASRVFVIGTLPSSNGRPPEVYANRRWKSDNVEHEVMLSEALLNWHLECLHLECLRGDDVDPRLSPDATILGGDWQLHVEMDRGTMSLVRVEARLRKYLQTDDSVLVICPSPARADHVLDRCAFLCDRLWCCSYQTALQPPEKVTLTRNAAKPENQTRSLARLVEELAKNPGTNPSK